MPIPCFSPMYQSLISVTCISHLYRVLCISYLKSWVQAGLACRTADPAWGSGLWHSGFTPGQSYFCIHLFAAALKSFKLHVWVVPTYCHLVHLKNSHLSLCPNPVRGHSIPDKAKSTSKAAIFYDQQNAHRPVGKSEIWKSNLDQAGDIGHFKPIQLL